MVDSHILLLLGDRIAAAAAGKEMMVDQEGVMVIYLLYLYLLLLLKVETGLVVVFGEERIGDIGVADVVEMVVVVEEEKKKVVEGDEEEVCLEMVVDSWKDSLGNNKQVMVD